MDNLRLLQHELIKNGILKSKVDSYSEQHIESLSNLIESFKLKNVKYEIFLLNKQQRNLIIIKWVNDYDIGDCLYIIINGSQYYTVEKTFGYNIDLLKALALSKKYLGKRDKKIKKLKSIGALNGNNFVLRQLTESTNFNLGEVEPELDKILEKIFA